MALEGSTNGFPVLARAHQLQPRTACAGQSTRHVAGQRCGGAILQPSDFGTHRRSTSSTRRAPFPPGG